MKRDDELRNYFQGHQAPPPRLEAQMETVRLARQAWEKERRQTDEGEFGEERERRYPVFALVSLVGVAAAALLAGVLFWSNPQPSPGVVAGENPPAVLGEGAFDRERNLLREVEGLFRGRLQFIVLKNGQSHIEVADHEVFGDQAVLLELRGGSESYRVISYSGNTVQLEIDGQMIEFDVLVAGDGEIIMSGPDFIWSSRLRPEFGSMSIEASVLSG